MTDPRLERRAGEGELDYKKRIVYGKLVDKTLADFDYAELAPLVYGKEYATDVARRMFYGSREAFRAMDEAEPCGGPSDQVQELRIERQRISDERSALSKLVRERARQMEINDILERTVARVDAYQPAESRMCAKATEDTDLLVSLCDVHYGADVSNYWGVYNSGVCREMFDEYYERVEEIVRRHNCRNCYVWANGDMISGNIHQSITVSNKENVIEQIIGVSELIAHFLARLSGIFEKVVFADVAGNHSRIDSYDKALKNERLDDLVAWYLRARLQNIGNIVWDECRKIDSTMYVMDIRGKKYVGVHGDCEKEKDLSSLRTMVGGKVYAVLMGHLHRNKIEYTHGVYNIMAGSFQGMDDYCITNRIYGKPQQLAVVCNDRGIECAYDIDLSCGEDNGI